MDNVAIFTGNAHPQLSRDVCKAMGDGVGLGEAIVTTFSDGEPRVQLLQNVRGVDVYVVQPTCAPSHNLLELCVIVDALRRASAGSITAVVPYYGYARQERKAAPRTPITAKLVTNMLVAAGVDRFVAIDLHAAPIQGFTDLPFDNLFAKPVLAPILARDFAGCVVVSPDAGGFERARSYSKVIPGSEVAAIDKRRERANESEVMNIIGEVQGRRCLILDDMIDTAGTLVKGAEALLANGATSVAACSVHGVFSGDATQRIKTAIANNVLQKVIVTDTLPLTPGLAGYVTVVSVAELLALAIKCIHRNDSVSSLFS